MRIPIRNKLIFTYLIISIFTALLIYLLTYFTSEQRIKSLAQDYQTHEMIQEITHWYAAEQQWQGFAAYFKSLHPPKPKKQQSAEQQNRGKPKRHGILDSEYRALLPFQDYGQGEVVPKALLATASPIVYQEQTIAWIIPPEATGISLNSELQVFLDNIFEVLLVAIIIGVLLSLLMGMLLTKFLLKPVQALSKAATGIANGELQQKVSIYHNDEIGDLAKTFNQMSQDLSHADQQRRQLTADISHDLGTPVQVLSGYIEMAQEGTLSLDNERLQTIADELEHIKRLVKDISLLAETDKHTLSLHLNSIAMAPLIERVQRLYQDNCSAKQIQLTIHMQADLPELNLDEERIIQVLGNLISNAIRYTPEQGEITLNCYVQNKQLLISVKDNGCGIKAEDLPYIFERFYRADPSRSGNSGKMGLGLTISRGLVEMQGGRLNAESDGINGSCFTLSFPINT